MKTFEHITVSRVFNAFTVSHKAGSRHHVERRNSYGISFSLGGKIEYRHKEQTVTSDGGAVIIHPMGESYDFTCTKSGDFVVINFYTVHLFTSEFIKVDFDLQSARTLFQGIKDALENGVRLRAMRLIYEFLERLSQAENTEKNPLIPESVFSA